MEIYLVVIFVMLSFGGGIAAMFVINNNMLKSKAEKILKDAEAQAEITKKDKMLEAKEKFLSLKSEHEKEVQTRNAQIIQNENFDFLFSLLYYFEEQSSAVQLRFTQLIESSFRNLKLFIQQRKLDTLVEQIFFTSALLRDPEARKKGRVQHD